MISYYTEEVACLRLRVWCSAFRAGTLPKLGSEVPCWMAGHWARWGALELRLWIQASAIERRCKPAVQANIYAFMFSAGSAMVWNRMLHGGPLSDLKSFRALGSGRVYPQKSIRKAYDM